MGKEEVRAYLDDYTYNKVMSEHNETGRSKSEIVNQRLRGAYEEDAPSLEDSFLPTFGQALFIAGVIIPLYHTLIVGMAVMVLGIGLVVGSNIDKHFKNGADNYTQAFMQALGA